VSQLDRGGVAHRQSRCRGWEGRVFRWACVAGKQKECLRARTALGRGSAASLRRGAVGWLVVGRKVAGWLGFLPLPSFLGESFLRLKRLPFGTERRGSYNYTRHDSRRRQHPRPRRIRLGYKEGAAAELSTRRFSPVRFLRCGPAAGPQRTLGLIGNSFRGNCFREGLPVGETYVWSVSKTCANAVCDPLAEAPIWLGS
jgi:hypothetical protein